MAENSQSNGRPAKPDSSAPLWRELFDALEGPVTRSSESWVQSAPFMDGLSLAWKLQLRATREMRRGLDLWLGAWRLASRGDVERLSNELARVGRELRELRREYERERAESPE